MRWVILFVIALFPFSCERRAPQGNWDAVEREVDFDYAASWSDVADNTVWNL